MVSSSKFVLVPSPGERKREGVKEKGFEGESPSSEEDEYAYPSSEESEDEDEGEESGLDSSEALVLDDLLDRPRALRSAGGVLAAAWECLARWSSTTAGGGG